MISAATSSNYEGKTTHKKKVYIYSFNRLFEPRKSPTSINILVNHTLLALERVIDCVSVTDKRGNSRHHLGASKL